MNCPQCGTQNPADAKFCGSCGIALSQVRPNPGPPVPPPPPPGGEAVDQGLKIGVAIGSVLLPIIGIIMGILYLKDANPEKQKAGKLWLICAVAGVALSCLCFFIAAAAGGGSY